ncbi:MAG: hypothetical protein N2517_00235 [Ignavibacteria bacterium]|nr:hypothetical protein [Ignavibacteria bacterium]
MKILVYFIVLPLLVVSLLAQEEEDTKNSESGTEINEGIFSKRILKVKNIFKHPSISISFGLTSPSHYDVSSVNNFKNLNFASIRLGHTRIKRARTENSGRINQIDASGVFLENSSSKFFAPNTNGNIDLKIWRFGYKDGDDGYGYDLGKNSFLFFTHGSTLNWSKIDVSNLNQIIGKDSLLLSTLAEQIRFGNSFTSGISLVLLNSISLDFVYERSIVYPGHKFWYWCGSMLIEGVAQFLMDEFINKIIESSPNAAPIVNAILKGGLSYGIYELRKSNMNWPFKTSAPFMNDGFKFGFTILF